MPVQVNPWIVLAHFMAENFAHCVGMSEDTTGHRQRNSGIIRCEKPANYDRGKLSEFFARLREHSLGHGVAGIASGQDRRK